jgi:hypothetical protein
VCFAGHDHPATCYTSTTSVDASAGRIKAAHVHDILDTTSSGVGTVLSRGWGSRQGSTGSAAPLHSFHRGAAELRAVLSPQHHDVSITCCIIVLNRPAAFQNGCQHTNGVQHAHSTGMRILDSACSSVPRTRKCSCGHRKGLMAHRAAMHSYCRRRLGARRTLLSDICLVPPHSVVT